MADVRLSGSEGPGRGVIRSEPSSSSSDGPELSVVEVEVEGWDVEWSSSSEVEVGVHGRGIAGPGWTGLVLSWLFWLRDDDDSIPVGLVEHGQSEGNVVLVW